jgi:hypothetical protein
MSDGRSPSHSHREDQGWPQLRNASDLGAALEFEAVNQDPCFHSSDFIEGVTQP